MGRAMFSKSLIQFSVEGWGCVPSLLFDLRPNYGGGNEDNGDLLQRSPGERNGNPLQYSCLENPMDEGAWWATVHGVTKSRTRLSNFTHSLTLYLHYLHHSLASGQTTVRAHSPTHQKKIGLKILLSLVPPIRARLSFLNLSHQEASISLLSFSIRGQTD